MRRILYMSRATDLLTPTDLVTLVRQARRNNEVAAITGMLVYSGQQFLQIIEGEPQAVARLLARLQQDARHMAYRRLADEVIAERSFATWSMAFCELTPPEFAQLVACSVQGPPSHLTIVTNTEKLQLLDCMRELLVTNSS
jgi:hypothetical protein